MTKYSDFVKECKQKNKHVTFKEIGQKWKENKGGATDEERGIAAELRVRYGYDRDSYGNNDYERRTLNRIVHQKDNDPVWKEDKVFLDNLRHQAYINARHPNRVPSWDPRRFREVPEWRGNVGASTLKERGKAGRIFETYTWIPNNKPDQLRANIQTLRKQPTRSPAHWLPHNFWNKFPPLFRVEKDGELTDNINPEWESKRVNPYQEPSWYYHTRR